MLRIALLALLNPWVARAAKIEFEVKSGETQTVSLPSPVDDSHLRDPIGYAGHGPALHPFTRRIELVNTGGKAMSGRLLIVNRRDFSSAESVKVSLGTSEGRIAMERIFSFWKDHRSHAGSGTKLAEEPFAALNFWGYTLCGEDTQALARLAYLYNIPARYVQLNGHLAAEYFYDNGWHMVDGDQNAYYLRLDNRTLASADEVRADPFLALRTKIFGKHSPMNRATSAFNTSLIEYVAPADPKPLRLKAGPAPLNAFTLQAGEKLIWHCDQPPETPVGELDTEKPDILRTAALATIEHQLVPRRYEHKDATQQEVRAPFPILKVVNQTTGETVKPKDIAFKAVIPIKTPDDKVSIFMQCSWRALPLLSKGENIVMLDAPKGKASVTYVYDPVPPITLPSVKVTSGSQKGPFVGAPSFTVNIGKADRLWWQISPERDFSFIPPNFDAVIPAAAQIKLDPFTDTFLSPGRSYYLRAKTRTSGVWSEWSPSVEFRVNKPAQPVEPHFAAMPGGGVRLMWLGLADEYFVYGSNRADFLPETLAKEEIVAMDHGTVTEKRPNQNLVGAVKTTEIELEPTYRFYRVIARKGDTFSVPSSLWRLPDDLGTKLPPATILQARASKKDGKDEYLVREEKLPVAKPLAEAPAKAPSAEGGR